MLLLPCKRRHRPAVGRNIHQPQHSTVCHRRPQQDLGHSMDRLQQRHHLDTVHPHPTTRHRVSHSHITATSIVAHRPAAKAMNTLARHQPTRAISVVARHPLVRAMDSQFLPAMDSQLLLAMDNRLLPADSRTRQELVRIHRLRCQRPTMDTQADVRPGSRTTQVHSSAHGTSSSTRPPATCHHSSSSIPGQGTRQLVLSRCRHPLHRNTALAVVSRRTMPVITTHSQSATRRRHHSRSTLNITRASPAPGLTVAAARTGSEDGVTTYPGNPLEKLEMSEKFTAVREVGSWISIEITELSGKKSCPRENCPNTLSKNFLNTLFDITHSVPVLYGSRNVGEFHRVWKVVTL